MTRTGEEIIVAVTQRVDVAVGRDESRDAIDQRLPHWLASSGFVPVCVPNGLCSSDGSRQVTPDCTMLEQWLQSVRPNALLLSGGNDIGEFPQRDATEAYLLSWAEKNRIPVLGICRGMQMIAVWAGAKLHRVGGHVRARHQLTLATGIGVLSEEVNSFHDWAIATCPKHFEVMAHAEDGQIEAIRHRDLPWEGWMWHPERETTINPVDTERMQRLFSGK